LIACPNNEKRSKSFENIQSYIELYLIISLNRPSGVYLDSQKFVPPG